MEGQAHFSTPGRDFFTPPALRVAPLLLGSVLDVDSAEGRVSVRVTEVEAYHGVGIPGPYDGGSHSRDRLTERNASMFGEPGHAYVYLSYGVHFALNMVCSPAGTASGVLLRAGTITAGSDLARSRRLAGSRSPTATVAERDLARGPGRLAQALGIRRDLHNSRDLLAAPFALRVPTQPLSHLRGPRVGVSGEYGGQNFPWRFWIAGDPSVSVYRPGRNVPV